VVCQKSQVVRKSEEKVKKIKHNMGDDIGKRKMGPKYGDEIRIRNEFFMKRITIRNIIAATDAIG